MKGCKRSKRLQIHHITPRSYASNCLHWIPEQINTPFNGITLCRVCHAQIHNGKHDLEKIYWNQEFDDYLRNLAIERTLDFCQYTRKAILLEIF
jgi:hypothetical protein